MRLDSAGFMRQVWVWGRLLPMFALALIAPSVSDAQVPVVTNITSSGLLTEVQPPSDGVYNIIGGTRPGDGTGPILFHSFGDFSVGQGDIASFLNDSGRETSNIIGRVTELGVAHTSYIYGTIRTDGFDVGGLHTNLFLVNPNGIVFGPQGSFDVGGSVSFSTAQYLRLFDSLNEVSANFYADSANDGLPNSVFAMAPVDAFGFLPAAYGYLTAPDPNATITVQGSALSVPSGQSISLVGGKIVIQGVQLPDGTVQHAQLSAPNGTIQLASATTPGEFASFPWESLANATTLQAVPNNPVDPASATSFTSFGTVSLALGSSIDVHGASTVWLKGGQLVLSVNDTSLNTSADPAPSNTISLSPGSSIVTSNSGTDLGVEVQLIASNVRMNGAIISTQTDGAERGGDVTVTADQEVTLKQSSGIFTGAGGEGAAGDVTIQGTGAAGEADSVTLSGVSTIGSGTGGSGAGGKISVTANSLKLKDFSTINSSTNGSGSNGDIVVSVQQQARLSSGATFVSDTAFSGEGVVGGKITVQGLQGAGSKAASLILEGPGTGIKTQTFGTGRLGDIEVHAETVRMTDGAVILAGTPLDTASAGIITIAAGVVNISGGSRISSQAFAFDAGPVTITADQLTLNNGSIVTNTSSPTGGRGGDVVLNVGSASLTNGATIDSSAENTGFSGNINILASGSVTMTNGSTITASSTGSGNAGDISINSKEVPGNTFEMQHSTISTSAALADGGNIKIFATNMVRLTDSIITSSVGNETKTDTLGGNVTIDPQFVVLQNSQIRANAFAGSGGAIDIIATSAFIADPVSIVDASSTLGVSGTVNIQSPLQNVGEEVTPLSEEFSSAAALLAQQCAARAADGKFSTFVVAAREGLPVEPGGFLASPSLTAELLGSRLSGQASHSQLSAVTGLFPKYAARPVQLAKIGDTCR